MSEGLVKAMESIVGEENVRSDLGNLSAYGSDSSVHAAIPAVAVRPQCTEHVQEIMRYANANIIPVTTRGAGTGMSGQAVPIDGGIVMDMKGMNRILDIRVEDTLAVVQPGVVDDDLNRALKPTGFFFSPTPASSRLATIGGELNS